MKKKIEFKFFISSNHRTLVPDLADWQIGEINKALYENGLMGEYILITIEKIEEDIKNGSF